MTGVQTCALPIFTDEGIRASDNKTVPYGAETPIISSITDISVDGVTRPVPGSSDGTAEAGIWIGHPVAGGVRRIRIRNVSYSGIETVNNAWDTTYTDLNIDMSGARAAGVGIYMEHFSTGSTFTGFTITGASIGIAGEWDYGKRGNAAAHHITITNGTIDAAGWTRPGSTVGVNLDAGSDTTTITNVAFRNQNLAAIAAFQNGGGNVFANNTFSLGAGATQLSTNHV